jgi:hypothetical protein
MSSNWLHTHDGNANFPLMANVLTLKEAVNFDNMQCEHSEQQDEQHFF